MLGNTSFLKNSLAVSIDWIAFTSTIIPDAREMFEFLGYSDKDFQLLPKGSSGYSKVYRLIGCPVSVMCEGNEGMGIHVVIPGSAVSDVLQHYRRTITGPTPFGADAVQLSDFDNTIMIEFLTDIKRIGWLTRLDLAVDDIGSRYFTVEDVRGYLDRCEVVSKFRKYKDIAEFTLAGEGVGHTVYLGSRQSEVMLRVYDKMLEQNNKLAEEEEKSDVPWVRWELELKNERADAAAALLMENKSLGEVVAGILNNYVRIIIPDDSNRSRCSILPLWEAFVSTVSRLVLYVDGVKKTIRDKKRWIIRQCLPTLAGLIIADGGSLDIITSRFDDAVLRMSSQMQSLVSQENPKWREDYAALF